MDKLIKLQDILRERLPDLVRWKKVYVYSYRDCPQWIVDLSHPTDKDFVVLFNGNKGKNKHNFDIFNKKLCDIDAIIYRAKQRLKNSSPVYK